MKDMLVNFKARLMAIPAKLRPGLARNGRRIFKLTKRAYRRSLVGVVGLRTGLSEEGNGR